MSGSVLSKLGIDGFSTVWPLSSKWIQTVAPNMLPDIDATPCAWHEVKLGDGDRLKVAENLPEGKPKRVMVMVHGLTGDFRSNYNIRLTRKLKRAGVVLFRINLRGAGPGFGLARKSYNAGQSQDVRQVLKLVEKLHPKLPVTLFGVSMGANIILKMLGEPRLSRAIDSFVAVSPPFDLRDTAESLRVNSPFFDQYFSKRLIKSTYKLHMKFPDLGVLDFPENCTVYDFDDIYTAPRHKFKSANDYYDRCSSSQFIPNIKCKGLVLIAKDDPIIHYKQFPKFDKRRIDFVNSRKGGHVGFFAHTKGGSLFWMDHLVEKWMSQRLKI